MRVATIGIGSVAGIESPVICPTALRARRSAIRFEDEPAALVFSTMLRELPLRRNRWVEADRPVP